MTTLYIVRGTSGKYDECCSWLVSGFRSQEQAEALVTRLNAWVSEWRAREPKQCGHGWYDRGEEHEACKEKHASWAQEKPPEDTNAMSDSYGIINYEIVEVEEHGT